jgi:hypothetical protein
MFLTGCSGIQDKNVLDITGGGDGSTLRVDNTKKSKINRGCNNVHDAEEVTTNNNSGIQPWMFVLGGLVFGFCVPQPRFIRVWF